MKGRKHLLSISLSLSTLSSCLNFMTFIIIWLIAKEIFKANFSSNLIIEYSIWTLVSSISGLLIYFLSLSISHLVAFRVEINIRKEAMKKIINYRLGFFSSNTSGKIRKVIDDNASITHSFIAHQLPDLASSLISPVLITILIFSINWKMGIACIFPIIGTMLIMSSMTGSKGKEFMKSYMNSLEEMNTEAVEYVRGIPVVKVFQQSIFSFNSFYSSIINYRDMVVQYTKYWDKKMSLYVVIVNSFAFILIPLCIILLENINEGTASINLIMDMFLYVLVCPLFASSIMKSMHLIHALDQAKQAIDRVNKLCIDEKQEVKSEQIKPRIKNFDIEIKNAHFKYSKSNTYAIKNISLNIPEGKNYALVGPSGSGKTSLAKLISGFWELQSGEIKIGSENINNINKKVLMSNISFVFQNEKLFKISILENLKLGKKEATKQEIEEALKAAQCTDIIEKLPQGIETIIGSQGTYLSGGEQQRICIARAILKNAPIIILDEATAFADPENEKLIQVALKKLTRNKTVLTIAHRLSSIVNADRIIVMQEGEIIQQDQHKNLIKQRGLYQDMWIEYNKSINWKLKKEEEYV
ncbi:MAG: ABC transporter ATP-binding protein/permease [Marinifilaceae bacterium]|nr:ABC transporter ATP-binding protein/permease [Marinifilaceae bacterium]